MHIIKAYGACEFVTVHFIKIYGACEAVTVNIMYAYGATLISNLGRVWNEQSVSWTGRFNPVDMVLGYRGV
jgi:hypothetical protein